MTEPQTIDAVALGGVRGGTDKPQTVFDLNVYRNDRSFAQQYKMRCVTLEDGLFLCKGSPSIAD